MLTWVKAIFVDDQDFLLACRKTWCPSLTEVFQEIDLADPGWGM